MVYRAPDETAFAKIQADIKARSRKVEPSKGGTGGLLGRGTAIRSTTAQERGKSTPGKPRLREAQVIRSCRDLLEMSPKVAVFWRQNTGAMKIDGRYLKFSFKGASDLMAVMDGSGKFLACECKATGKLPDDDQAAFLANVSKAGGYAMCVDDPAYLAAWLAEI